MKIDDNFYAKRKKILTAYLEGNTIRLEIVGSTNVWTAEYKTDEEAKDMFERICESVD